MPYLASRCAFFRFPLRHSKYSLEKSSLPLYTFEHFRKHSPYYLNVHVAIDLNWESRVFYTIFFDQLPVRRIRTLSIYITSDGLARQLWSITPHYLTRRLSKYRQSWLCWSLLLSRIASHLMWTSNASLKRSWDIIVLTHCVYLSMYTCE